MFERWLAGVIGIVAIVAGLVFAALPFSFDVGSSENSVTIHARPPIVSAWSSVRRGPIAASAVGSGGRPYAAREARTRLLGSLALVSGGTVAIVFARRRRRSSRSANSSLPPPLGVQTRALPPPERTLA